MSSSSARDIALSKPSRRLSQVYVEIPETSLYRRPSLVDANTRYNATPNVGSGLNGNASLKTIDAQVPGAKRKLSNNALANISSAKKPKFTSVTSAAKLIPLEDRDGVQCTFIVTMHNKQKQCGVKLCRSCLKNRYGENLDDIKSKTHLKEEKGHIDSKSVLFKCPKCRDICNCWRCRKAKGLASLGVLPASRRRSHPVIMADLPGDAKLAKRPQPQATSSSKLNKPSTSTFRPRAVPKAKVKIKVAPPPKWTEVPTSLSLSEAEDRIYIREFIHRFSPILRPAMARVHLADLEYIGGLSWRRHDEEYEMTDWVSEAAVKSIIISLLLLIADDMHNDVAKIIRTTTKEIQAIGVNLSRIWALLANMRDATGELNTSSSSQSILEIPDPLPPPTSLSYHNVRTTRSVDFGSAPAVNIVNSAQMTPVIVRMIEIAIQTSAVREEIVRGVAEGKEVLRKSRDAVKGENERWDKERKENEAGIKAKGTSKFNEQIQDKRSSHKQSIHGLDTALKVALNQCVPRFKPLGRDHEGRIYWVLTPGALVAEEALEIIEHKATEAEDQPIQRKITRRRAAKKLGEEERKALLEWSWFVAVWGRRPEGMLAQDVRSEGKESVDSEDSEDEDPNHEAWWGFADAPSIRKLAAWIADSEVDENFQGHDTSMIDERVSEAGLQELADRLTEFADVLEWRIQRQGED